MVFLSLPFSKLSLSLSSTRFLSLSLSLHSLSDEQTHSQSLKTSKTLLDRNKKLDLDLAKARDELRHVKDANKVHFNDYRKHAELASDRVHDFQELLDLKLQTIHQQVGSSQIGRRAAGFKSILLFVTQTLDCSVLLTLAVEIGPWHVFATSAPRSGQSMQQRNCLLARAAVVLTLLLLPCSRPSQ